MWVRKKIEISPTDLLRGVAYCCLPASRRRQLTTISDSFGGSQALTCLSVRSGFDLFLASSGWPAGTEVIMSGLTIPDMFRIVSEQKMKPVGVDIDLDTLAPDIRKVREAITSRTKAIVVAHLFGGLVDMEPVIELAREHGLLVIEDCAQAYIGSSYTGHRDADISMFSFGPIKTNTALGGGVLVVRRPEILRRLNDAHSRWPRQTRLTFAKRVMKYAFVRFLSTRLASDVVARSLRWLGRDHDQLATKMARGFPGPKFFDKIRHQPSTPLLMLLARKLATFDTQYLSQRVRRGDQVTARLSNRVDVLGAGMRRPTYWVYPIMVDHRDTLVRQMWQIGFDATTSSSLKPVAAQSDTLPASPGTSSSLTHCQFILDHLVFLPFDLNIPDSKIDQMVRGILQAEYTRPARPRESHPAPPRPEMAQAAHRY